MCSNEKRQQNRQECIQLAIPQQPTRIENWYLAKSSFIYWKRSLTGFRIWMSIAEEKLVLYYSIFLIFSKFYSISNNSTMNQNRTMKLCEYILYTTKTNIAKCHVSIPVGCWGIVDCLIFWWYFQKFKLIFYLMDFLEEPRPIWYLENLVRWESSNWNDLAFLGYILFWTSVFYDIIQLDEDI